MIQSSSFENTKQRFYLSRLRKQKALLERDIIRMEQSQQKSIFIVKILLLSLLLFTFALIITVLTSLRFHSFMNDLTSCQIKLFEAANLLQPICKVCITGWNLQNGTCVKS